MPILAMCSTLKINNYFGGNMENWNDAWFNSLEDNEKTWWFDEIYSALKRHNALGLFDYLLNISKPANKEISIAMQGISATMQNKPDNSLPQSVIINKDEIINQKPKNMSKIVPYEEVIHDYGFIAKRDFRAITKREMSNSDSRLKYES